MTLLEDATTTRVAAGPTPSSIFGIPIRPPLVIALTVSKQRDCRRTWRAVPNKKHENVNLRVAYGLTQNVWPFCFLCVVATKNASYPGNGYSEAVMCEGLKGIGQAVPRWIVG